MTKVFLVVTSNNDWIATTDTQDEAHEIAYAFINGNYFVEDAEIAAEIRIYESIQVELIIND